MKQANPLKIAHKVITVHLELNTLNNTLVQAVLSIIKKTKNELKIVKFASLISIVMKHLPHKLNALQEHIASEGQFTKDLNKKIHVNHVQKAIHVVVRLIQFKLQLLDNTHILGYLPLKHA